MLATWLMYGAFYSLVGAVVIKGQPLPAPLPVGLVAAKRKSDEPEPMEVDQTAASSSGGPELTLRLQGTGKGVQKGGEVAGTKEAKSGASSMWPNWPKVNCKVCSVLEKWSRMESRRDEMGNFEYRCFGCCASQWNVSIEEARGRVMRDAGCADEKKARIERYKSAVRDVREFYPAMSSSKEIKMMAMKAVQSWFSGLGRFVLRKRAQMNRIVEDMDLHAKLCLELESCTNPVTINLLLDQLEQLAQPEESLAYSHMTAAKQEAMIRASSYSDEWCEVRDSRGTLIGSVTSYYVCLNSNAHSASSYGCCLKVIPSKDWSRAGAAPELARRWYCTDCEMKFRASWGQVVIVNTVDEHTLQPVRYYLRAEVPPWACEDIRAMTLEEARPHLQDPKSLYESLRRVVPQKDNLIVQRPGCKEDGRYFVSKSMLDGLPFFDWHQIFKLAGTELPEELNKMLPKKDRRPPK
jgi:hypothetical protein